MPSLNQIHRDLCWVIYISQKHLIETNLQQNPLPGDFIKNMEPFQYLFNPSVILSLSNHIKSQDEKIKNLAKSLKFVLTEYGGILSNFNSTIDFQIAYSRTRLRVLSYDVKKRLSVLEAYQLSFSSELDRSVRFALHDAYSEFILKKTFLFEKVLKDYHLQAKSLGFHNIYEMLQDATPFSINELENRIETYLENTKKDFQNELGFHLEDRSGMGMKYAHATDLRRSFDPKFLPILKGNKKKVLEKLDNQLNLNSISKNIKIIQNETSNYPFALKLIQPDSLENQNYLIINKKENILDWRLYFREIGHIFYFSNIDNQLPLINQMTGDIIFYEYTAKLLERLVFESQFLLEFFRFNSESLRIPKFQFEIENRNVLINCLHQIRLLKNRDFTEFRLKEIKFNYEKIFYEYFGFYRQGYDYLAQIDFKLYSILAKSYAILILDKDYAKIQSRFSNEWWKNLEFGNFLKENLFRKGFQIFQKNLDV